MTAVIIGSIGFLCCFLYDHNSIRLKKSFLHPFFSIGCFLIAVSTGLVIRSCWPRRGSSFFISAVFLTAAILFLGLLIYTLFFPWLSPRIYCNVFCVASQFEVNAQMKFSISHNIFIVKLFKARDIHPL